MGRADKKRRIEPYTLYSICYGKTPRRFISSKQLKTLKNTDQKKTQSNSTQHTRVLLLVIKNECWGTNIMFDMK
jgi:hypothetical protein